MALSKTEVNLRRLLAAAPQQQNQVKLIHYVATLREQLEQSAEEKTSEGLPSAISSILESGFWSTKVFWGDKDLRDGICLFFMVVSKGQLNEYSEKIEGIATKVRNTESTKQVSQDCSLETSDTQILSKPEGGSVHSPRGLRRRLVPPTEDRSNDSVKVDHKVKSVKLDSAAHTHIEKHRKLQDNLTDEMVGLARQLKESALMMSQSIQNTEIVLESTDKAVEQNLSSTGHANTRAMEVYSQSFKTLCATWLAVFVMICIFIMVVLLIRVT